NKAFDTIELVEDIVEHRCRQLLQQQKLIQRLTFYHWWPEVKVA
ncbi:MAG: IS630 family transposase, partial [Moorea sp. SIO2I5]|nr:IS630 family transposase [Moorena sp. SIO2I5]NEQ87771.1 IS630 family transposase [Moorena sp. SIO2I5]NEQ88868.1 IS630 family transposase [Moorena sp. SIO2I5]